ncbi:MAG: hypothetical protein JW991_00250 [Candidatus Pacebacteria bacterium]|nr:hypothetical protein [Candidatus Paceibacterota bacterium]
MIKLLKQVAGLYRNNFSGSVIAYTDQTNQKLIMLLKKFGSFPLKTGLWGESRMAALKQALKSEKDWFFLIDFDKLLHWLKTESQELLSLLKKTPLADCLVLGREEKVMATYPQSWIKTESIINHLAGQIIGFQIDITTATQIINRRAARIITRKSVEKSWGACVEFPFLVFQSGLKIAYQPARGMTWEDPDRFEEEIKKTGGLNKWQKEKYDTQEEWGKRLKNLSLLWETVERLSPVRKTP